MWSARHGLPQWERYLIDRFGLEHIAVAAKNGQQAMLYDPARDVGLAVWFDECGIHLQLGGELWPNVESGTITSQIVHEATDCDLTNGRFERITDTHGRQIAVLRMIFDDGDDDLLNAWITRFGHETITQLGGDNQAPHPYH